jgi:hypothetical protein
VGLSLGRTVDLGNRQLTANGSITKLWRTGVGLNARLSGAVFDECGGILVYNCAFGIYNLVSGTFIFT